MRIKTLAENILDKRVLNYLNYNTFTARHYGFMCKFDEHTDFGINLIDCDIEEAIHYLNETDSFVVNKITDRIIEAYGKCKAEYIIYFFLYHESYHWLEYLESGLSGKAYCKTIELGSYDGKLIELRNKLAVSNEQRLRDEYNWVYRSTPYEKRADDFALIQLGEYLKNNA